MDSTEGETAMRLGLRVLLCKALLLIAVASVAAQTPSQSAADGLRAQLHDLEAQETVLQERARQLDEQLRPENIERSLALTGSTKPEDLRAQRQRELEREKEKVRLQLEQLAASRARLQSAIAAADAEAYRQSASPAAPAAPAQAESNTVQSTDAQSPAVQPARPAQRQQRRRARRPRQRRRKA